LSVRFSFALDEVVDFARKASEICLLVSSEWELALGGKRLLPDQPRSVYSSSPVLGGGIVVLEGTTRRRSLKPKGPKIEAEAGVGLLGSPSLPARGSEGAL